MKEIIERKNSFRRTHNRIIELIDQRLNKLGPICTDDVWKLCRQEFQYGTVASHFKIIMQQKIENAEADFIRNGNYFIYRQKK